VRYLQEKGYVRAEWDEDGEFRVVRLTEKGIDLVEGSIRDAGVLLPR
jgi:DNA-binding PadR family transcriptional regulator